MGLSETLSANRADFDYESTGYPSIPSQVNLIPTYTDQKTGRQSERERQRQRVRVRKTEMHSVSVCVCV